MRVVKRTNNYIYVRLGDRDMDHTMGSSDLVRVERGLVSNDYTLSDAVKCDGRGEEIDYPTDWVALDEGPQGSSDLPSQTMWTSSSRQTPIGFSEEAKDD